ncbi:hypothetical protein FRC02_001583 [Tulasnella sp. 418]|nr:hypothetical protein FRC02_001583 [Tulasnella sp. 418]
MSSGLPAKPSVPSPPASSGSLPLRERIGDRVIASPISRSRRTSPPRSPRREREHRDLSPPRHYPPARRDDRDRYPEDRYRRRSPPPLSRREDRWSSERDGRDRDYARRSSRSEYYDHRDFEGRSPPYRRPPSPRRDFRGASPRRSYRSPSPPYPSRPSRRPSPPYSRPHHSRRSRSPVSSASYRRPPSPYRRPPSPYRRRSRSPPPLSPSRSPGSHPSRRWSPPPFSSKRGRSPTNRDATTSFPSTSKRETQSREEPRSPRSKIEENPAPKQSTDAPAGFEKQGETIGVHKVEKPETEGTPKSLAPSGPASTHRDERTQDSISRKDVAPPTGPRRQNVMARTNLVPRAIPTKPRADRIQTTDPAPSSLKVSEMRSRDMLSEKSPAFPASPLPSVSQKHHSPRTNAGSLPTSHSASPQPPSGPKSGLSNAPAQSPESTKSQNDAVPVPVRRPTPQGPKGMSRNTNTVAAQQLQQTIDLPIIKKPDFLEAQEMEVRALLPTRTVIRLTHFGSLCRNELAHSFHHNLMQISKISAQRRALQKSFESIEIACDRAAYELDISTIELQAAETRRVLAEAQLERAISGKPLMDQTAIQV